MQNLLLKNANVVSVNETFGKSSLLIENGKISKIINEETTSENFIDLTNCTVFRRIH